MLKSKSYYNIFVQADIVPNDSAVLQRIGKLLGLKIKNKLTGVSLVESILFDKCISNNYRIGIIGSSDNAIKIIKEKISICETRNKIVFKNTENWSLNPTKGDLKGLVNEVIEKKIDIMFFALGAPKQEILIYKLRKYKLNCVMMAVGGSIDMLAGVQKYWPKIIDRLGVVFIWRMLFSPIKISKRLFKDIFTVFKISLNKNITLFSKNKADGSTNHYISINN